jgi:flagellar protein FlbD
LILLTQLNGTPIYVNPTLIETLESTPDTIVTLTNGKKLMVRESPEVVTQRFTDFAAKAARPIIKTREEASWI